MANKIMKTLTMGENIYEIYDESARTDIATLQTETRQLSDTIGDKATLENGVIKFYKKATTEDGADTELFSVDVSSIGGTGGLDLKNLTLSVSQVGEYQRLSMSDGTTTKTVDIPITAINDDQVQTAVNTWLDNNPDAISTSVDGKIHIASQWNNPRKTVETKTGRINIFENASKSLIEINTDISDKTVIVHGVNYFDYNDLVSGAIAASTGVIKNSTTDFYTEHLIPIEPNKILYWNRNNEENTRSYLSIHFYDKNQTWISCNTIGSKTMAQKFAPSSEAYYMRVSCASLIDAKKEKLLIADIDVGDTKYGYTNSGLIVTAEPPYFGKTTYIPYVGYRIENGVLIGVSNSYTVEEVTHVDVFESETTIEVSTQMELFSTQKLSNVQLKFGRYADTEYTIARIFKSAIDGGIIKPKLIAVTPNGIKMSEYAKANDFIMAINAGSFDTNDNSCIGTTIVDGVVVTDHLDHNYVGSCDVLTIDGSGNLKSYPYETTTDALLSAGVVHAVQGKCTLIDDYAKYDLTVADTLLGNDGLVNAKHPRTAIGQFKNGDYMIFVCGGRETNQAGMTCAEMQELFISEGLKYAYNLDGGGSCSMMFYKKELASYSEARANPTFFVFN